MAAAAENIGQASGRITFVRRRTIALPEELDDRLIAYAHRRNVAVSALIRMLLSASMEREQR